MGMIRTRASRLFHRALGYAQRSADTAVTRRLASDYLFHAGLAQELHYLAEAVDFLASCWEPLRYQVTMIRPMERRPADRFASLLDAVASGLPSIPIPAAVIALRSHDASLANHDLVSDNLWAADAGIHARYSSSTGYKGRLLATAVHVLQPTTVLELGTAWGQSAIFLLSALASLGSKGHLTTCEPDPGRHRWAKERLEAAFPGRVDCRPEPVEAFLPTVRDYHPQFVFHDAFHSRDAYVADFLTLEPTLPPGAVLMMDDIRWEDPRFGGGNTYSGWREIAAHPRVSGAAEIGRGLGILCVR